MSFDKKKNLCAYHFFTGSNYYFNLPLISCRLYTWSVRCPSLQQRLPIAPRGMYYLSLPSIPIPKWIICLYLILMVVFLLFDGSGLPTQGFAGLPLGFFTYSPIYLVNSIPSFSLKKNLIMKSSLFRKHSYLLSK